MWVEGMAYNAVLLNLWQSQQRKKREASSPVDKARVVQRDLYGYTYDAGERVREVKPLGQSQRVAPVVQRAQQPPPGGGDVSRRRVTKSDHEAHDLNYYLPGYADVKARDLHAALRHYLSGSFYSHSMLLEIVMDEAPLLLAGRVQVVHELIRVDSTGLGVRAWVDRELPTVRGPQVINVLLTARLLDPYYRGGQLSPHANVVYVNPDDRTIEFFEPQGVAEWTFDVVEAIKAARVLPTYEWVIPTAACPISRGVRQRTGPQAQLQLGLCAQFSQQYALYRVLNPGVPAAKLNRWLSRGGPKAQLERFERTWAWVLEYLRRSNPSAYRQIMTAEPASYPDNSSEIERLHRLDVRDEERRREMRRQRHQNEGSYHYLV